MKRRILSIIFIIAIGFLLLSGLVYALTHLKEEPPVEKPLDLTTAIVAAEKSTTEKEKKTTETKKTTTEKSTTTEKVSTTEKITTTEKVTTTEAPTTTEASTTEIIFEQTRSTEEPPVTTTEAGVEQGEPEIQSLAEEQDIVSDSGEAAEPPIGTEEPPTEEVVSDDPHAGMTYLGTYICTAYMWTGNPCYDGVYPELGYTVACNDPALWHRWVWIDGYGARYVHDKGGMPLYQQLDIYLGDYDSCIQFGRRDLEVWLMN